MKTTDGCIASNQAGRENRGLLDQGRHDAQKGSLVKPGNRLIIVDKDGVLIAEFQLRDSDLADPPAFVAAIHASIEAVEEEDP